MSKKKEDEPVQVKDTSRPARDAESMKQTTGMSQSEWEDIKRNGTPTDAQYEARYQSLLKRYNISPENYKTSKSGAAEYRESPKTEEPKKSQQKSKPQSKNETKSQTVKNNVKKPSASKNNKKTAPSESTGRPQTSKTGTNTPLKNTDKEPVKAPPNKGTKTHPVGGWKEENQDVRDINNNALHLAVDTQRRARTVATKRENLKRATSMTSSAYMRSQKQNNSRHIGEGNKTSEANGLYRDRKRKVK